MDKNKTTFDNTTKHILFTSNAKFEVMKNETGVTTLSGYALIWNALSSDRGGYKVRLLPSSATFLTPTFALINHDYGQVLARSDDNSLRIMSDDYGVKVEIDLPQTSYAKDLEWLVANQKIRGMSFAMLPNGDYEETEESGVSVITFSAFQADEVTVTPIPAFDETSIQVKADSSESVDTPETMLLAKKEIAEQFAKLETYRLDSYTL